MCHLLPPLASCNLQGSLFDLPEMFLSVCETCRKKSIESWQQIMLPIINNSIFHPQSISVARIALQFSSLQKLCFAFNSLCDLSVNNVLSFEVWIFWHFIVTSRLLHWCYISRFAADWMLCLMGLYDVNLVEFYQKQMIEVNNKANATI